MERVISAKAQSKLDYVYGGRESNVINSGVSEIYSLVI